MALLVGVKADEQPIALGKLVNDIYAAKVLEKSRSEISESDGAIGMPAWW